VFARAHLVLLDEREIVRPSADKDGRKAHVQFSSSSIRVACCERMLASTDVGAFLGRTGDPSRPANRSRRSRRPWAGPTVLAMPPLAALGDSFRSFFEAVEVFLTNLAAVSWGLLAAGLLLHAAYVTVRTRAWFNALRGRVSRAVDPVARGLGRLRRRLRRQQHRARPRRGGGAPLPGPPVLTRVELSRPGLLLPARGGLRRRARRGVHRLMPSPRGSFPTSPTSLGYPGWGSPGRPAIPSSRSSS